MENSVKVTAERIPESKVLLRIEIPPEQVQQAIERTYRDLSRRVRIPGFRPGKAPKNIVERYVGGPETVQQEGLDRLIDESYRKALEETDTRPIGDPDILERPEFHPGETLVIEAAVPVAPVVELGDYQSIRVPKIAVEATPEQVNQLIDSVREANAEWVSVERGAQNHDHVVIDVRGTAGTVPSLYGPTGETLLQTSGGKEVYNVQGHDHNIDVEGPVEFAPGFDEELIGMTAGSEKRFGLTLPSDFADKELANQSIVFDVKVSEVKEKHLPEIDDAFALKVEGGETVEELRETARMNIQRRLEQEANDAFQNSVLDMAIERSTVEIPDVMIERQIDSEIDDLKGDLIRQRVNWQDYLQRIGRTEDSIRADIRAPAERTLRSYLVLREIARKEDIEVAPDEVNAEIELTAMQFGRAAQVIRERLSTRDQREKIEARIFYRKAVRRLAEIAEQPVAEAEPAESSAVQASADVASAEETSLSQSETAADAAPSDLESAASDTSPEEPTTNG